MRIFVSHSTAKDNATGRQRLLDLEVGLTTDPDPVRRHEVLLDMQRLEPGARWRSVLDEWMASCHSAVLMLDPVALKSAWVLKEATILAHRAACDPAFLLFPALLDGVRRDDLAALDSPFSKLYLDAIQRLSASDAAGISAQVKAQLAQLAGPPDTPLDRLAATIESQLRTGSARELEAVCLTLTGAPVAWTQQDSRAQRCARLIASAIVRGERGGYTSLSALMEALRTAGIVNTAAETVLNCAAPLWVHGPAAAPLADLAQRNVAAAQAAAKGACWATALNGNYVAGYTADMYLRRAFLPARHTVRTVDGGESEARAAELTARIRDEVKAREPSLRGATAKAVDAFLARRRSPYFILLPPPVPDEAVLRELQDTWPAVTFILHTGETLPPAQWPARVLALEPPVDLQAERDANEDYSDALERIRKN
jgi:hypothetical protein